MSDEMFKYEFRQLAVYENGRTPVLLNEEQYRRARACVNACAGIETQLLEQFPRGINGMKVVAISKQRDDLFAKLDKEEGRATLAEAQRDDLLAALQSISNITGDAGFNIGGPLEHCPGELPADEVKRLLSLACEYLKDISKEASRAIARVKGGAA